MMTIETAAKAAANAVGLTLEDMRSPSREATTVVKRQVVATVLWLHGHSYSDIGRYMSRHHSTVMHAVSQIQAHSEIYPTVKSTFHQAMQAILELEKEDHVIAATTA